MESSLSKVSDLSETYGALARGEIPKTLLKPQPLKSTSNPEDSSSEESSSYSEPGSNDNIISGDEVLEKTLLLEDEASQTGLEIAQKAVQEAGVDVGTLDLERPSGSAQALGSIPLSLNPGKQLKFKIMELAGQRVAAKSMEEAKKFAKGVEETVINHVDAAFAEPLKRVAEEDMRVTLAKINPVGRAQRAAVLGGVKKFWEERNGVKSL